MFKYVLFTASVIIALLLAVPTDQSSINSRQKRQNRRNIWNSSQQSDNFLIQNGRADGGFINGQSTPQTITDTATPSTMCMRPCIRSSVTNEYSPVCGTNGQSYNNVATLNCAKRCGINVEPARPGKCVT